MVIALLLNKLWAYPWTIIVLVLFIGYQLYRIVLHPTAGLIALTVFDVLIVALTWREYRQQRRIRTEEAVTAPIDDAAGGPGLFVGVGDRTSGRAAVDDTSRASPAGKSEPTAR